MTLHAPDRSLTDAVIAAGRGTCGGYVYAWERRADGAEGHGVWVTVRTCRPLEGYGPPESVEGLWPFGRDPLLGGKVTVALVHAESVTRSRPDLDTLGYSASGFAASPVRLVVNGTWVVTEDVPAADTPHVVAGPV